MTASVEITCLCGEINESLVLKSTLPVRTITCSCNICRYCTGVLYLSTLHLTERPACVDKLHEYSSSSRITRYFCGSCGSHVLILGTEDSSWSVCSGVVERVLPGQSESPMRLEQYSQHEFVGDTLDGGLMVCLAELQGHKVPFFMQGPDEAPVTADPGQRPWPFLSQSASSTLTDPSSDSPNGGKSLARLRASCHCGGVQFNITRPSERSYECSSPWPDLIVPYHSESSENPADVKWWLRAGGSKYLAGTCACRSCRLESGVPIQTWAFIPKANIQRLDGSALDYSMGTLKRFNSSPGCYREFCGTCGATVFWHCEERPYVVDVSVGILRAQEGSRAESWLEWWTDRLSFREHAFDAQLADDLENGLRALKP